MKPKYPIAWRRRANINSREIAFSAADAWAQENAGGEYWMRNPDLFGRAVAAVAQGVKLQLGTGFKLATGDQIEDRVEQAPKTPMEAAWIDESAEIEALHKASWDGVNRLSAWLIESTLSPTGTAKDDVKRGPLPKPANLKADPSSLWEDLAEIRRILSSWDASGVPVARGDHV